MTDRVLWGLAALSAGTTMWLSLWGVPPDPTSISNIDKVEHLAAYFVTSGLLFLAAVWRPGRGDGPWARYALALAVALVVAAGTIEALQAAVGRDPDVLDWLAGSAGIAAAFVVGSSFRGRAERAA